MAKLYMMIGIPSSGKSNVVTRLKRQTKAKVYSSDKTRLLLNMDPSDDNENIDLFEYMYDLIRKELSAGNDVILDSTNTFRCYRQPFLDSLNEDVEVIGVLMLRKLENCLSSNAIRKNKINDKVIIDQYSRYDFPLKEEGFDSFMIFYTDNDKDSLAEDDGDLYKSMFVNNGLSPEEKLQKVQQLIRSKSVHTS